MATRARHCTRCDASRNSQQSKWRDWHGVLDPLLLIKATLEIGDARLKTKHLL